MSEPVRVTLASPRGMVYSPLGTSSLTVLYSILASKNTTGSGSLIADSSRPACVSACYMAGTLTHCSLQEHQG